MEPSEEVAVEVEVEEVEDGVAALPPPAQMAPEESILLRYVH